MAIDATRPRRGARRQGLAHQGVAGANGAGPAAPGGSRHLGLALVVISMAQLMLVLDDTLVTVALPSMQRSLHLATSHLNQVISFYALAFGGLLAGGRADDP